MFPHQHPRSLPSLVHISFPALPPQLTEKKKLRTCQWVGISVDGNVHFVCVLLAMFHPWRTYVDLYGNEERVKIDFCVYHCKYCVDPMRRHGDTPVPITVPNSLSLCNECYVQDRGTAPSRNRRILGRRRADADGEVGGLIEDVTFRGDSVQRVSWHESSRRVLSDEVNDDTGTGCAHGIVGGEGDVAGECHTPQDEVGAKEVASA